MNNFKKKYWILAVLIPFVLAANFFLFSQKEAPPLDNVGSNQRFVESLSEFLDASHKVPSVIFHQQKESRFFAKHMALFVSVDDLKKIRDFVKDSLQFEKDLFDPFSPFKGKRLKEPVLDFESLFEKYIAIKPIKKLPVGYVLVDAESPDKVQELKIKLQSQKGVESIKTVSDFIPTDQTTKVVILKEIQSMYSPATVQFLGEDEKRAVEKFLAMDVFKQFTKSELPVSLQFGDSQVLIYPKEPLN